MLTVIEPHYHCFNKPRLEKFLSLMKEYGQKDIPVTEKNCSTFIIAEDVEHAVYGGAQLIEKRLNTLNQEIKKHIERFVSYNEFVWICSVFLHYESQEPFVVFESFCWTFYRELYEKLVEFGASKGTGFLYMILDPGEYLCTEGQGLWPYVFEVKPQESPDRLFHGVLPLIGTQYEAYKKRWKELDSVSQE